MTRTERQKESIKKWISAGGKASIVAATGFGKTYLTCMLIQKYLKQCPKAKILISVPTDVLKTQWIENLIKHGLFYCCKVEIINTVVKHNWIVDLLVQDEAHRIASETFKAIFDKVQYNHILCLTATMERLDGKEVIITKHCPVVDTITVQEAVSNGWLAQHRDYKVMIDVDLTEYNELNRKFNMYFAYFNYDFNCAMNCMKDVIYRRTYAKKMGFDHNQVTAMAMDWMRCLQARKNFVKSHPKKLEIVHRILEARQDKKCITFSATIKDAERIKYGKVLSTKQTKQRNRQTLEEFKGEMFGTINTSKLLDEGIDLPGLSVGIIISGDSSMIKATQRKGRVIRAEKGKIAEMFTLVIRGTVENTWYNNAAVNQDYITIDEEQLDAVLRGEQIETRKRDNHKNIEFRF